VTGAGRARGRWLAPLGRRLRAPRLPCASASIAAACCGQRRLSGPVISVGNLSVGGSGKTPLVARVAEILRDAGEPVAV
jgi:tetraacyldisaccharide-1-P 4'-kinase